MSSGGSSVLAADWPEAAKAVVARGWIRLVEAVVIPVVQALLDTRRLLASAPERRRESSVSMAPDSYLRWTSPRRR